MGLLQTQSKVTSYSTTTFRLASSWLRRLRNRRIARLQKTWSRVSLCATRTFGHSRKRELQHPRRSGIGITKISMDCRRKVEWSSFYILLYEGHILVSLDIFWLESKSATYALLARQSGGLSEDSSTSLPLFGKSQYWRFSEPSSSKRSLQVSLPFMSVEETSPRGVRRDMGALLHSIATKLKSTSCSRNFRRTLSVSLIVCYLPMKVFADFHPSTETIVLVTTDETSSGFHASLKSLGWYAVNHAAVGTASLLKERHGDASGWWDSAVDQAILSLGKGFVGTLDSQVSLVSALRVASWNDGATRFVKRPQWPFRSVLELSFYRELSVMFLLCQLCSRSLNSVDLKWDDKNVLLLRDLVIITSWDNFFTCGSKQDGVFLSEKSPSAPLNPSECSPRREETHRLSSLRTFNIAEWWVILNQSSLDQLFELFAPSSNQSRAQWKMGKEKAYTDEVTWFTDSIEVSSTPRKRSKVSINYS